MRHQLRDRARAGPHDRERLVAKACSTTAQRVPPIGPNGVPPDLVSSANMPVQGLSRGVSAEPSNMQPGLTMTSVSVTAMTRPSATPKKTRISPPSLAHPPSRARCTHHPQEAGGGSEAGRESPGEAGLGCEKPC